MHTIMLSMYKRNSAVFGFVEYNSHILLLAPFLSFFLFLSPSFSFSDITKVPEVQEESVRIQEKVLTSLPENFCYLGFFLFLSSFLTFSPLLLVPFLSFFLLLRPLLLYLTKPEHSRVFSFIRIDSVYLHA